MVEELKKLDSSITYRSPPTLNQTPTYLELSDANIGRSAYGQTGYISGLYLPAGCDSRIYQVLDWVSGKQARVSFSSIGAEILAAATRDDRGVLMEERIAIIDSTCTRLPFFERGFQWALFNNHDVAWVHRLSSSTNGMSSPWFVWNRRNRNNAVG